MINQFWYALPLVVVISLVYSATRHELMRPIVTHAIRLGAWIICFMAGIFLLVWMIASWLSANH
jgi:hypothetical protein